jgi:hypothetical protein
MATKTDNFAPATPALRTRRADSFVFSYRCEMKWADTEWEMEGATVHIVAIEPSRKHFSSPNHYGCRYYYGFVTLPNGKVRVIAGEYGWDTKKAAWRPFIVSDIPADGARKMYASFRDESRKKGGWTLSFIVPHNEQFK